MKSIFDSSFKYTPSIHTDVRKTFDRIRREQRTQVRQDEQAQIRAAPVSKLILRRPAPPSS